MATGFKKGAVDLDDIFDPYVEGAKPAATGYKVGAIDLNQRYAPLEYGTPAEATGMKIAGGADLNTLWAAKGSASYTDAIVIPFGSLYEAWDDVPPNVSATMSLGLNRDGTWSVSLGVANVGTTYGSPLSGTWCEHPSSSIGDDYQVRFTASVQVDIEGDPGLPPTYSTSTGWLTLSETRDIAADTQRVFEGGAVTMAGSYLVEIRQVGGSAVKASSFNFRLVASNIPPP